MWVDHREPVSFTAVARWLAHIMSGRLPSDNVKALDSRGQMQVLYQKISTGSHICDQIALIMRGVVDYSVLNAIVKSVQTEGTKVPSADSIEIGISSVFECCTETCAGKEIMKVFEDRDCAYFVATLLSLIGFECNVEISNRDEDICIVTANSDSLRKHLGKQWSLVDPFFSFQLKLKCMFADMKRAIARLKDIKGTSGSSKKAAIDKKKDKNEKNDKKDPPSKGNNSNSKKTTLPWDWKQAVTLPKELDNSTYRPILEQFGPAMLRTLLPLFDKWTEINDLSTQQLDNKTNDLIKSYIQAHEYQHEAAVKEAVMANTAVMQKRDVQNMRKAAVEQWTSHIDAMLRQPEDYFDWTYKQGAQDKLGPTGDNMQCTHSKFKN